MKNFHIILADDDKEDREFFSEALFELYPEAFCTNATDGAHLMELLQDMYPLPDLIFLDLNMPKKNGFACLVELKESPGLAAIPIIILSTSTDEKNKKLLLDSGALKYFSKPSEYKMLKEIIETSIKESAGNTMVSGSKHQDYETYRP